MKPKRFKQKIITKDKSYPIQDSVLYKLSNKKRLEKIIFASIAEMKALYSPDNYRCFFKVTNGKQREIEAPKLALDKIHTRIASLLLRIEIPDSLHSGVKGRSNVSNAQVHKGNGKKIITVDIKGFFRNTTRSHVFDFFLTVMKCSPDISDILSRLVTINDHVPTGSRVSMPIAYFANKKMFDEMDKVIKGRAAEMTIYVDDLTFSGSNLNRDVINCFKVIANRYGHTLHPEKTRFYAATNIKLVTGVAIHGSQIRPRGRHLKELNRDTQSWLSGKVEEKLIKSVTGRLNYFGSIDSRYKDKARSFRAAAF